MNSLSNPKVTVIGAGAFGGWIALHLLRSGVKVTLLDAWGPGNSRASSGGDTRVIRGAYAGDQDYIEWVARSFTLWKEAEQQWQTKIYQRTGALWMHSVDDQHAQLSIDPLHKHGLEIQHWSTADAAKRFPLLNFERIQSVYFEPEAGYLLARRSCSLVLESFVREGGNYQQTFIRPGQIVNGTMKEVKAEEGTTIKSDLFVFACGPWLGRLFPDVIGSLITPTRQEVYFFGTPQGDRRFNEEHMPVWLVFGKRFIYGIPGNDYRGFKVADDTRGEPFDPTDDNRMPTQSLINIVRDELRIYMPALADAPLLEARVCQYEQTPDSDLIIDRHPGATNVWIVGGGSGHGFKFGPALGEYVAQMILEQQQAKERFYLNRNSLMNR
ncbi:FAD-dependent oxidoreductase [Chitinophagaceae bacterium LB-8]|uniref:FAD-dependent oxidoreductase n=1 Tax=Paraflavisolibacter caeni TaxID=2982496 RepID=A0A9X3BHS2_9BACT|nr:FAD-dependent oxidoreductase [Paraflavisolibacter caeni]MCU7550117.1 FAD-dependent oxidoreductase [Paraflavisolibacter caeni]